MTIEEIKNHIGKIVWHIGLGAVKIKSFDKEKEGVVLVNPSNEEEEVFETKLYRLEID